PFSDMIVILIYRWTQFKFTRTFEPEQKFIFFKVINADNIYSPYRVTFAGYVAKTGIQDITGAS
ncbi:MAG: hypothetical protein ACWGNI_06570, partial [Desulfobacterales bacterium]